jgi:hypothetical protein
MLYVYYMYMSVICCYRLYVCYMSSSRALLIYVYVCYMLLHVICLLYVMSVICLVLGGVVRVRLCVIYGAFV